MKLNSLELRNFKGIKNLEILPNGTDLNIYGDNGTGKTTVFDAFMWLLFDKDSNNSSNFNIKTLDAQGQVKSGLEHEVRASLVIRDRIVELQKIYREKWTKKRGETDKEMTGHETDYFVDGVPKKKKEFTEFLNNVIDEETFRILTNPLHFNTKLEWKKRREVALQLVEDVNISDVIKANSKLKELEDLLIGDTTAEDLKAKTQATKRKLNKQLEQIPEQRKLKAALMELGVTQLEASAVLGISREAFNKKLNGVIRFTLEEAFKMSSFTNKPIEDIFLLKEFTQKELDL